MNFHEVLGWVLHVASEQECDSLRMVLGSIHHNSAPPLDRTVAPEISPPSASVPDAATTYKAEFTVDGAWALPEVKSYTWTVAKPKKSAKTSPKSMKKATHG